MPALTDLATALAALDGSGYKAYKTVTGSYDAPGFRLLIDHVQGDPFAEPSRLRAFLTGTGLPPWARDDEVRRVATADFLNRRLAAGLRAASQPGGGSGRSGELQALLPGQAVLRRSALRVSADGEVEARFRAGLPARGRTILGQGAARLITDVLPAALHAALVLDGAALPELARHIHALEDARALRDQLEPRGLVAFVADGARLARRSGIDDRPLEGPQNIPFTTPETRRVTLHAPHAGTVTGMGIPAGVTLIVGGGYHGKSTLLRAIQLGVYDHIAGDGRERAVTVPHAVKVRAEDGRAVAGVDISNFIGPLPGGAGTAWFTTANASGSTSQAASLVEALEAGCRCLLLDEDTSATNFMIRDARMQALIPPEAEPITPFVDRVRQLRERMGVSTLLVAGGSGDYFDVADTVIAMRDYLPADVTGAAARIASEQPTGRRPEGGGWRDPAPRVPLPGSLDPSRGRRPVEVRAWREDRVGFGREEVDLAAVEQIVELAQAKAIAHALAWMAAERLDGIRSVAELLDMVADAAAKRGLDAFQEHPAGELAEFRAQELAAFLARVRTLRIAPPAAGA
jgi:predicted ABC-class ATPase